MDHFNLHASLSTITPAHPFGTSTLFIDSTTDSTLLGDVQGSTNTYFFPPDVSSGNYMFAYQSGFANAGTISNLTVTPTNATGLDLYANNTASRTGDGLANSTQAVTFMAWVTVTASPCSIIFTTTSTCTSCNAADLYVIQMPNPIN